MSNDSSDGLDSPIGLAELIAQVKQELLSPEAEGEGAARILSVDSVTLELNVTVEKKGEAGIHIQVIKLGGSLQRQDVQKVTVQLTPLISREERVQLFKANDPHGWQLTVKDSHRAFDKGQRENRVSF